MYFCFLDYILGYFLVSSPCVKCQCSLNPYRMIYVSSFLSSNSVSSLCCFKCFNYLSSKLLAFSSLSSSISSECLGMVLLFCFFVFCFGCLFCFVFCFWERERLFFLCLWWSWFACHLCLLVFTSVVIYRDSWVIQCFIRETKIQMFWKWAYWKE